MNYDRQLSLNIATAKENLADLNKNLLHNQQVTSILINSKLNWKKMLTESRQHSSHYAST